MLLHRHVIDMSDTDPGTELVEHYLQDLQGYASSYRHYDMLFSEVLFELLDHHRDILRLDRDEDDVGVFDNLQALNALRLSPGCSSC